MRLFTAPLRSYWDFLCSNTRFIGFGFLLTLASSVGQTFFIGLFNERIRDAFSLSSGEFGLLYSLATLCSGFSIIWLGALIDRMELRTLTLIVCAGMITASCTMALAPTVAVLGIAIYLLRLNGQGLLGHIAITSMARYFTAGRGKAISLASLGYPAGEALLPIAAVTGIALVGWRNAWLIVAYMLTVTLVPMVLWLLVGHGDRHRAHIEGEERESADDADEPKTNAASPHAENKRRHHWTRRDVVRDIRFHMLLPTVLAPPFIGTGIFFHQTHIVAVKDWKLGWFASCFIGYAVSQFIFAIVAGELVDRFGARRLLPFYLAPMMLGLLALAAFDHPATALVLLLLMGVTSGSVGPLVNAAWAELYGTKHLGAIRALATSLMVFSTAASPALLGWLIDRRVSVETISLGFAGYISAAALLAFIATRITAPKPAASQ